MAVIIDGKAISGLIKDGLAADVAGLKKRGITPKLTVLLIGNNPASEIYVKNKEKAAIKIGIESVIEKYPADISQERIIKRIRELNKDNSNHGILVQLPLPKGFDEEDVLLAIDPGKDVDGFHPINIGKLVTGQKCLRPCTPAGVIELIESTGVKMEGKDALVIGRSNIVGKPVAIMLLQKNATVTVCHSKTQDLEGKIKRADIIIAAIGRPEFVKGSWIKKGAVVIDVGINKQEDGKLCGDVEFDKASEHAGFITPVPGGVGPMTIAMLMKNTVNAAKKLTVEI